MPSAELILFAIRSIIKLGSQAHMAYVDSLKRKDLVLPLPNFPAKPDETSALYYFRKGGAKHVNENPRLNELFKKAKDRMLTDDEKDEFCIFHQEMKAIEMAKEGKFLDQGISAQQLSALCTIRQWERGADPNPTALRRIGGTLVEVAVDYYAQTPELLNSKSAHSKLLLGFFQAIDDTDFVNTPVVDLAEDLFIAAVETIGQNPFLATGDDKGQLLVQAVAKGLAGEAAKKIKAIRDNGGDLSAEERVEFWAQLIFRSTLSSAGDTVFQNPDIFLDIPQGAETEMVSAVGKTLLDIVIDDKSISFERILSRESMDAIIKASLGVLSRHPELLVGDHEGLKKIISQVAESLSQSSKIVGPDIIPKVIRMVLEKTALNLEMVWPGDVKDPKQHLLIIATSEVMEILVGKSDIDGKWRPNITQEDTLSILELVIDEVVENPDWLIKEAGGEDTVLGTALEGALEALKGISDNRLSLQVAPDVIKSAIKAVALRREFLEKVIKDDNGQATYLLTLTLDMIFDVMMGQNADIKARWVSSRKTVVTIVVERALMKLSVEGVNMENIEKLKKVLEDVLLKLTEGGRFSLEDLKDSVEGFEI